MVDAQHPVAPVLSGSVPPLAAFFLGRQETGFGLADGLRPGETTLLVPAGGEPANGLAAAGMGETQLAVGFAHAMWSARAVDLLVWVPAGNRTAVIASYARAVQDLSLLGDLNLVAGDETADATAQRFLGWLRRTQRRWAVVLDGVTSPADVDGLWPAGPAGQVVVTTRLREADLRGAAESRGGAGGAGLTAYGVPGFSRRESLAYLTARLTAFPDQRIEALDLAEDVGGLPIALAQAAGVITAAETTCRDYRGEYDERLRNTAGTSVDGCPQPLLATWSLAVEHAHELSPAGLSWPALVFAGMLDTSGIPAAVVTSPAACGYITGQLETGGTEQNLVRAAYANLERLGLLSVDTTSAIRTVWVHSAVRAVLRAYLAPGNVEQAAMAAATALLEAWPERTASGSAGGAGGAGAQLGQALRDCTAALRSYAGELLWKPDAHPVLLRAGASLTEGQPLADAAVGYWQAVAATSGQLLGHGHAQSVLARDWLVDAYVSGGRLAEALPVFEEALDDRLRVLGPQHPDAVTARLNVARSLQAAGREPEAIALLEQVLTARERQYGPAHRHTLTVRSMLAAAYSAAGRQGDSIRLYEGTLAAAEREHGPAHSSVLKVRAELAGVYLTAGQSREAVRSFQRVLADAERALGPDHPETMAARAGLANAYRAAGRSKEAVRENERVLADRERVLGADHPDTITARGNLAYAYRTSGRLKDAIPQYERALADREQAFGPDHRDTLAARAILAAAYQLARRMREAVAAYERTVADGASSLGPGDIDTLTARCNLATAYYEAGRMADGVKMLRGALADCERYLGPGHPMTTTVRENLQAATE
jgi:tetratricopeptide (TPR) repeat protein